MQTVDTLPDLPPPRHIDLADRVGLVEWSYAMDESGLALGLECTLRYGAGDSPRKVCVSAPLDMSENVRKVLEQDAIVLAMRETLEDPTKNAPMFGYQSH